MTMAIIEVHRQTGAGKYYSAGHNPLLWVTFGGEVQWLPSHGLPLGLVKSYQGDEEQQVQLVTGDYLVMYTDGITEAMNKDEECFGEDRLAAIAVRAYHEQVEPEVLNEWIMSAVRDWLGDEPSGDDLTLNTMRFG